MVECIVLFSLVYVYFIIVYPVKSYPHIALDKVLVIDIISIDK